MRLIDADAWIEKLSNGFVTPNYHPDLGDAFQCMEAEQRNEYIYDLITDIQEQPTAYDVNNEELRFLKNYLYHKPKTYRQRNQNWIIVRDLLMSGTSTAGMTSCIAKCRELGIDPYGCNLNDSE